jgi:hypothetical protein
MRKVPETHAGRAPGRAVRAPTRCSLKRSNMVSDPTNPPFPDCGRHLRLIDTGFVAMKERPLAMVLYRHRAFGELAPRASHMELRDPCKPTKFNQWPANHHLLLHKTP